MSLRAQGPTFTANINCLECLRRYIKQYLRAINHVFRELLEGAAPLEVDVNASYCAFQKNMKRSLACSRIQAELQDYYTHEFYTAPRRVLR
jgi:hypothetical protein